ncbi:MAG: hypothetical protein AAFN11_03675 [Chloroflexota bacterium]
MHSRIHLFAFIGTFLVILIGVIGITQQAFALSNDGATIEQGGVRLTNAAATAQAAQSNVGATVESAQANVALTAQARSTQLNTTVEAVSTNLAVTADAARTEVDEAVSIRATEIASTADVVRTEVYPTVVAVSTSAVATLQSVAEEIDDALTVFSLNYDETANTLTVTTAIDETQINTAINTSLEAAGYDEVTAVVDLVENGVIITLENVTLENGQIVDAVVTLELFQDAEGNYTLDVTSITVNGSPVPVEQFEDVLLIYLETYLETIITGETSDFTANAPAGTSIASIEVDNIVITADVIAVRLVITLE